jgi:hypothetical protein
MAMGDRGSTATLARMIAILVGLAAWWPGRRSRRHTTGASG